MKNIIDTFAIAKSKYDSGASALAECIDVIFQCLTKIERDAELLRYGDFKGKVPVEYWVAKASSELSRPFRPESFESNPASFKTSAMDFLASISDAKLKDGEVDKFVYTGITAFCICFDIWKRSSRKTPGTFFEVLIGSICMARFPKLEFGKHIKILNHGEIQDVVIDLDKDEGLENLSSDEVEEQLEGDSVSTDLVIYNEGRAKAAVIPLKITTRERIVQPFAHQRILDSAYPNQFRSFLACVSEVQRDEKSQSVKQICVPGTVALFQKHLAQLSGLYYCDIPHRYAQADMKKVIEVKSFSQLFTDIDLWLNS